MMRNRLSPILKLIVLTLVAIFYQSCDSTLNIEKPHSFLKYIGGDGRQVGIDFVTDEEGNIYILGSTTSTSDGTQVYVVKTDAEGVVQWEQVYGDAGDETPKDIERLKDGNVIVVSDRTDIIDGERDFVIHLLNHVNGTLLQPAAVLGDPGVVEVANSVAQTENNEFIVAGYTEDNGFKVGTLRRFNSSMQERTEFGGSPWTSEIALFVTGPVPSGNAGGYDVIPIRVIQTKSSGEEEFYIFGYTNAISDGSDNVKDYNFFVGLSTETNFVKKPFFIPGPETTSDDRLTDARQIPAEAGGGWIMTGYTSPGGIDQQDLYMLRLIPDMSPTSVSLYDPSQYMRGSAITLTSGLSSVSTRPATVYPSPSRNFLILGEQSTQGTSDIYLTGVTQSPSDFSWSNMWPEPKTAQVFGGEGNDTPAKVEETADGSILVLGTMTLGDVTGQTKIVLMRLDSDGMLGK